MQMNWYKYQENIDPIEFEGKSFAFSLYGGVVGVDYSKKYRDSIEERGGRCSAEVSAETDYLIYNAFGDAYENYKKARELGVRCVYMPRLCIELKDYSGVDCAGYIYILHTGNGLEAFTEMDDKRKKFFLKDMAYSVVTRSVAFSPVATKRFFELFPNYVKKLVIPGSFETSLRPKVCYCWTLYPDVFPKKLTASVLEYIKNNRKKVFAVILEHDDAEAMKQFLTAREEVKPAELKEYKKAAEEAGCEKLIQYLDTVEATPKDKVKASGAKTTAKKKEKAEISAAEHIVLSILAEQKLSKKDLQAKLKDEYSITDKNLPVVKGKDGQDTDSVVLAYLLTVHDRPRFKPVGYQFDYSEVVGGYAKPGICAEAQRVVEELDAESLQNALLQLADKHIGKKTINFKERLSYPICRYADEALMEELTLRARKWHNPSPVDDSFAFTTFREANLFSNTRASVFFAERYDDLRAYAKIHDTDEDVLIAQYMSSDS